MLFLLVPLLRGQTQATAVPLILPGGLAYDASGNLYFAETANHIVRRVSTAGTLTTLAGTGVQGFAGDGGPATAAMLDSPSSVAIDASGNVFVADAHNHRIRRVDAVSGVITTFAGTGVVGTSANGTVAAAAQLDLPSALAFDRAQNLYFADARTHVVRRIDRATTAIATVAGNGRQGYSGDLGLATLAAIDSPSGIALDSAGNLYLADTHNHRVRRVDAATGIITTATGSGQPGFSGDGTAAATASINLPRGLALDAAGNLFIVDSRNQRIRRIDGTTGQIATIAGGGIQGFAGDGSPAVTASLDTPRAVTISPANLPTLADSANGRVRQVDSAAVIHTIAGLGVTTAGTLTLTGSSTAVYGTGSLTATLVGSSVTGSITFFDSSRTLATVPLLSNAATLSTSSFAAGAHSLTASYSGDTLHAAARSNAFALTVTPAPALAIPTAVSLVYGQPIPALSGTISGILPQDSGLVSLALSSSAAALSPPAAYPIVAAIAGPSAGNYALTQTAAAVAIGRAPSGITLSNALAVHVASTTAGVPSGTVNLYDGSSLSQSATLSPTGDATFSSASMSNGTHTLTASYTGDGDFLASTSSPVIATIGTGASADFSLASTGQSNVAVPAGSAATFSFSASPINGALSSPILLSAGGLPTGATASFNPAYLPPSAAPTAFTLTIRTPVRASVERRSPWMWAMLLPVALIRRRRRHIAIIAVLLLMTAGCGDRINTTASVATSVTYNVTVIGTATSTTGATLQHSVGVTLTLQ